MNNADSNLRSFLLWDRPALRQANAGVISEVLQAFDLVYRASDDVTTGSVFATVARGLSDELRGQTDSARTLFASLADSDDVMTQLVGRLFLIWMQDSTLEEFREGIAFFESLSLDTQLAAWINCKLATWALDRGWRELSFEHLSKASLLARGDLHIAIQQTLGWFTGETIFLTSPLADPLVLQPWITQIVSDAAEDRLERGLTERRVDGRQVRRWGSSDPGVRRLASAELQATWAGALWLLPAIRQQHAAHLLTGETPTNLSFGLSLWVLGGGQDSARLINSYESKFDDDTASDLITSHLKNGARVIRRSSFISACLAVWDQLPDQTCQTIAGALHLPSDLLTATHDDSARLFAALMPRIPAYWWERFSGLRDVEKQVSLINLNPEAVRTLDSKRQEEVFLSLQEILVHQRDIALNSNVSWASAIELASKGVNGVRDELFEAMPSNLVAQIGSSSQWRELLPLAVRQRAKTELKGQVEEDVRAASQNTVHGRFYDPSIRYAESLASIGSPTDKDLAPLIRTVEDNNTNIDLKYGALRGLAFLAVDGYLPEGLLDDINLPSAVVASTWTQGGASMRLIGAALTALRAVETRSQEFDGPLLALTRDPDERIRALALDTVLSVSQIRRSSTLDTAMFGALYDPSDRIQQMGIEALRKDQVGNPDLEQASSERIEEMWALSSRSVRETIVRALISRSNKNKFEELSSRIVDLAQRDRSWIVRVAAAGKTLS